MRQSAASARSRPALLPTRAAVLALVRAGHSYEEIGERLALFPGLAYFIATGVPCDSSDGLSPEDLEREGLLGTSSQHLASPPLQSPPPHDTVHRWLQRRAAGDGPMQSAAGAASDASARSGVPQPMAGEREA